MKNKIFIFNVSVICILGMLFYIVPDELSEYVLWFCLSIFYVVFLASIKNPIEMVSGIKTYVKIEVFFLLFFYILFYFPYQQYLFGHEDLKTNSFVNQTFNNGINKSIILSTIGLISFYVGIKRKRKNRATAVGRDEGMVGKQFDKKFNAIVLILTVFIIILYSATGLTSMLVQSYIGANSGLIAKDATGDGIYFLTSHFSNLAIAVAIVYYYKYREINAVVVSLFIVSLTWAVILLVIGDRNSFFIIAVIAVASYYTFIKSISRIKIVIFIIFALFVYQVIEVSRQSTDRSLDSIVNAIASTKVESAEDSSFSITTITSRAAVEMVPSKINYFWGKFKIIGIAGIVPYSRKLFVAPTDDFVTSSDVLSYAVLGDSRTWSVGSNIISDIYLDFGVVGVIVLMYFLGVFAAYLQFKVLTNNKSTLWLTVYVISIGLYSELPRYSFDFPVRNIAWTFLLFYLCKIFLRRRKFNMKTQSYVV